jgi:hypothetical protein
MNLTSFTQKEPFVLWLSTEFSTFSTGALCFPPTKKRAVFLFQKG